MLNLCKQAHL